MSQKINITWNDIDWV